MGFDLVAQDEVGVGIAGAGGGELVAERGQGLGAPGCGKRVEPDEQEAAARDARVQQWAEDSGNAALMGRELPPADTLAADQRITAWARQLKAAGLDGDMDVLRARAYLDLLLGKDSHPRPGTPGGQDSGGTDSPGGAGPGGPGGGGPGGTGPGDGGSGPDSPGGSPAPAAGPQAGVLPAGFAWPAGPPRSPAWAPVDPWLARDLAAAANPRTSWCVTVTDEQGHAVGHGCARPQPRNRGNRDGPGPPGRGGNRDGPGFAFTAASPGRRGDTGAGHSAPADSGT